jgi:hypothetical protein
MTLPSLYVQKLRLLYDYITALCTESGNQAFMVQELCKEYRAFMIQELCLLHTCITYVTDPDPGSGIFLEVFPGSQTHIFDSLMTNFWVQKTIILSDLVKKFSLPV